MIIKSAFKDYYDFVANQFGGGDPRIVYVRKLIAPMQSLDGNRYHGHLTVQVEDWGDLPDPNRRYLYGDQEDQKTRYLYLILAGRCYLLAQHDTSADGSNVNLYKLQPLEDPEPKPKYRWAVNWFYRHLKYGVEYPFLIELSRKVGAPVFVISAIDGGVTVSGQCPILNEIGFPALISPYQMYQDLAYFVGNTMKPVPDNKPPVEVSNREKIVKAGFDLVTSFRHRKSQ